jgi:hypothetical protein
MYVHILQTKMVRLKIIIHFQLIFCWISITQLLFTMDHQLSSLSSFPQSYLMATTGGLRTLPSRSQPDQQQKIQEDLYELTWEPRLKGLQLGHKNNNLTTTESWNDGFYSGNYPNMGIVLLFYELLFHVPRLLVSK